MLAQSIREQIVEYGKLMYTKGLTLQTGGYLTIYDRDSGIAAISPSALSYMECTPEDVVVMDLDGNKLEECNGRKPSTEWPVVQKVFSEREDINAIFHCHSMYATTLSALRLEVPAAYFELASIGGSLRCTDYHLYTEQSLADDIMDKMQNRTAALMGNHGLIACGKTMKEAYERAEMLEFCCEVYWRAKCIGDPVVLNDAQMAEIYDAQIRYKATNNRSNNI